MLNNIWRSLLKRFLWLSVIFIAGLFASCSLVSASVVTLNPVTYPNDMVYPGDIIIQNYAEGVNISTWFQNDSTHTFGHQAGSDMAIEIYNSHDTTAIFSVTVDNPPPLSYTTGTVSGQSGSPTITGTGTDWNNLPTTDSLGTVQKYLKINNDPILYQITNVSDNSLVVSPNLVSSPQNEVYSISWYRSTADATSGVTYENAPMNSTWLKVPATVTVKAHQLLSVPISFKIPAGAPVSNYDMRITVTDVTNASQIMSNEQVRFLVTVQ
jgi:hypothetical protein